MYVVINVDDLGLHPAVTRAVAAGAEAGVVTSASLLAGGPCLGEALSLGGVGLGAHLNILRGRPLSPAREVPSLLGPGDAFLGRYRALWLRHRAGKLDLDQVELEWGRQVESLLAAGARLDHLDSEKHIHVWPGLWERACRLARRFGIPWLRRPLEPVPPLRWDMGALRARVLAHWCKRAQPGPDLGCPDLVWGVVDQAERLTPERFRDFMARQAGRGARVVEIACHPGRPRPGDPDLPGDYGPMRVPRMWRGEWRSLSSGRWPGLWDELGLEPASYRDLKPGEAR